MEEQEQSTEVAIRQSDSNDVEALENKVIFGKFFLRKIIIIVALIIGACISFGPLAERQSRNNQVGKTLLQAQSDGKSKEEGIQKALTEKSKQIMKVWVAMKAVNGVINLIQSAELTAGVPFFGGSVNPGELLAPLDNTLDKISNILLWALGAVLFEKLLLAISGYVVFKAIIPVCLLISVFAVWKSNGKALMNLFFVTILICLVVRFAVPISFELSTVIEKNLLTKETEHIVDKISKKHEQAESMAEKNSKKDEQAKRIAEKKNKKDKHANEQGEDTEKNAAKPKGVMAWVNTQVSNIKELGNALVTDLINFIMVFILTNIAIPILTLLGLYWFTKHIIRVIMGPERGRYERGEPDESAPQNKALDYKG